MSTTLQSAVNSSVDDRVTQLSNEFQIVGQIDLRGLQEPDWIDLFSLISSLHRPIYDPSQRLIMVLDCDWYKDGIECGMVIEAVQRMINSIDISNFFVELITTNPDIEKEIQWLVSYVSTDPVPFNVSLCKGPWSRLEQGTRFRYDNSGLHTVTNKNLEKKYLDYLKLNQSFCLAPWTHLFVNMNSVVSPCCRSSFKIGEWQGDNLRTIWNDAPIRDIRQHMLQGKRHLACSRCYKTEDSGKKSYRSYINNRMINHISKIDQTQADGHYEPFEINYLHFKFNNLCNLACRTCEPLASSSWHKVALNLGHITQNQPALVDANQDGRLFQEFLFHLDSIDLIKFTGGEPLMMPEFYDILQVLIDRNRTHVELFYNTNLTKLRYRHTNILDLWQHFPNVRVGASLDAEGTRNDYLRSFSKWSDIVENRKAIKNQCPHVIFWIAATVSIINVMHLPDFHRSWVEQDLIQPQDFDINLLSRPDCLDIINLPVDFKRKIRLKYKTHLNWIYRHDRGGKSATAFESVINVLDTPGEFRPSDFWNYVDEQDRYHGTNLLEVFPELADLPR